MLFPVALKAKLFSPEPVGLRKSVQRFPEEQSSHSIHFIVATAGNLDYGIDSAIDAIMSIRAPSVSTLLKAIAD